MARKPLAEMGRTELEDLPDWIFDPPRGRLLASEDGSLAVTFDGEPPRRWRTRRDDYLHRAGLPGVRDGSREFRRAFREEARRRRPTTDNDRLH
jgi:hypothetical protein